MAEAKKASTKTEEAEGGVTYEDHGDHLIEVDTRTGTELRRRLPKAQTDVPVDKETQESVQARVDAEKAAAENEGRDPVEYKVPPLKEEGDVTVTASGAEKKS